MLDALIILMVVAIVAISFVLLFNQGEGGGQNTKTIEFNILATNLTAVQAEGIKAGVGAEITFGNSKTGRGLLTNVEIEPYEMLVPDAVNGINKMVPHPELKQIILTVQAKAYETDDAFMVDNEQICVGEKMPFLGKGFGVANAYVCDLRQNIPAEDIAGEEAQAE